MTLSGTFLVAAPALPAIAAAAIALARPAGDQPSRWAVRAASVGFLAAVVVAIVVAVNGPVSAVVAGGGGQRHLGPVGKWGPGAFGLATHRGRVGGQSFRRPDPEGGLFGRPVFLAALVPA